ncbi:DUF4873 domain-containing protein [Nocardia sp. BMG51109]|uniref:DUF4873 domain-containing protein n=1 Tax=Nocardia sp. BMG51109 TaxID=1056816 RepID=UPI000463621F|nr:DUF4873 domain-containing protein [Nocardia sp. BMG51109]
MELVPEPAEYEGPATVTLGEDSFSVRVRLRGHRQPIDGVYRWYGRIDPHPALNRAAGNRKKRVRLHTPEGVAEAQLGDRDFWGRLRVTGHSTPPFRVATAAATEERTAG